MSNEISVPYNEVERMAAAVAKSGLFGIKTSEQAIALMLIAQAEGLHPAIAARDYHIIQGRPALKSDAMLARFQQGGGKVEWGSYTDMKVSAKFSHPSGGSVTIEWTMEAAKRAGLATKDVWKQYPRQMLRARVISEGIRTVAPGFVVGMYTPEEIDDLNAKPVNNNDSSASPADNVIEADFTSTTDAPLLTAAELLALIEAQITDADIKRVCTEHRKDYDALSESDKAAIISGRKAHIEKLKGAA